MGRAMTDIVERLVDEMEDPWGVRFEAAGEIKRLRVDCDLNQKSQSMDQERIAELEAALEHIHNLTRHDDWNHAVAVIAEKTLKSGDA